MYKKKKDFWSFIFIVALFIVFVLLFLFVINANNDYIDYGKKIEL